MPLAAFDFPALDPILFQIGPVALRWYSLGYILGFVAVLFFATRMIRSWGKTVTTRDMEDIFIWAVLGVVIGGRLGFVLFYGIVDDLRSPPDQPDRFLGTMEAFRIWRGGMSFHGGLAGVFVAVWAYCRFNPRVNFFEFSDFLAALTPIGIFFGRMANFINAELYGRPSDVPWAVRFPHPDPLLRAQGVVTEPRHPSQLYEAFLEGIVLLIIVQVLIRIKAVRERSGIVVGTFLAGYGIFRWSVEWVREPEIVFNFPYPGMTMGQLLSIPMIIVGVGIIAWAVRKPISEVSA